MDAPVFIVGTERSGSNLLRLMLDAHSRLFVPHPPHVMNYFARLEPLYGDLSHERNLRRLATDVLRLVEGHIHRWDWIPSVDAVLQRAPTRDAFGVYVGLYEAAREHAGKPRWGCKSTFMVEHGPRVLATFADARFLWLVRDPRDVAVSSRRSVFSPFHPVLTARLWERQQAAAEALPAENTLRVHYEALVGDPEAEVARICAFLGEAAEPAMLAWYEQPEAKRSASLSKDWENTGRPIQARGVGRWREALTGEEIALVETVCGERMERLGYARSGAPPMAPDALEELRYRLSDRRDWLRVEWRSLREDANVRQRWGRALLLRRIRAELALRGPA